jgi:hypothetical protein
VTNISQAGESVTVTTGNGTQLTADYVIVTVPLGVLKNGSIGFEPQLPADKQAAIRDMVRKQQLMCAALCCSAAVVVAGCACVCSCNTAAKDGCSVPAAPPARVHVEIASCIHRRYGIPTRCLTPPAAAATTTTAVIDTQPQGMGVLDKVVLVFRPQDVFWNRNIDLIINLNTPDDLSGRW